MLEASPEGNGDFDLADALPEADPDARSRALQDLKKWLKALPLSRRPLCKVCPPPLSQDSAIAATKDCRSRLLS
jgi:hypothetical protein